jgi:hypothetical protein
VIWTAAILACLAGAVYLTVRRVRRHLRESAGTAADLSRLTEAQRAQWERMQASHRRQAAAERDAANRPLRERELRGPDRERQSEPAARA